MEKLFKKLLKAVLKNGIFLAVLLTVVILPNGNIYAAGSDSVETYDGIQYHINYQERWASVCGYVGTAADLVIPSMISRGIIVSEIEGHAFDGCSTVQILEIPDTIMKIDESAFLGMESLKAVVSKTSGVNIVVRENVKIVLSRSALDIAIGGTEETKTAGESGESSQATSGSGNASAGGEKDNTSSTASPIENIGAVDDGEVKEIPVGVGENPTVESGGAQESAGNNENNNNVSVENDASGNEKENSESGSNKDIGRKSEAGKVIAVLAVIAGVVAIASGIIIFYRRKNSHIEK